MASDKQPSESTDKIDVAESKTGSPAESIGESIDELESLFAESSLHTGFTPKLHPEIPVLNDVVDAAEARRYAEAEKIIESIHTPADKNDDLPIVKLSKLVDSVDKKLSNELDALVDILKDTIKDSIMDELKEQLKKETVQPQSPPPDIDGPDKPFEWVILVVTCVIIHLKIHRNSFIYLLNTA